MKPFRPLMSALLAATITLGCALSAGATELPAGVLNYLRQKDPNVQVRFDGLVIFSNGESYVPVIPQDPSLNADAQQVIMSVPEKAPYPNLIEFDNHFFLMRLVQTSTGRLTFPKLDEYPLQLKEGLLPQDFVLPNNLFIPVELKVILGALPYNPTYVATKNPVIVPAAEQLKTVDATPEGGLPFIQRSTYVFDLNEQKAIAIQPDTGRKTGDVSLECVPSSMKVSPDGKLLFAPCLTTDELVVVDTGSNLIKTRIPVGGRPDAVMFLDASREVVVSNRFSPFISIISTEHLVAGEKVTLPGNGGAMALIPDKTTPRLVIADAFKPQVYVLNLVTRAVERTVPALPNISAMQVQPNAQGQPELWAASRTQHKVQVINLASGTAVKTFEVGTKPVDLAVYGDTMHILSAGSARLDRINWQTYTVGQPIALTQDSFPSGMVVLPSEKRAVITTAGSGNLILVGLESGQVQSTMPVEFRASMITMTPDKPQELPAFSPTQKLPSMAMPLEESPTEPAKPTQATDKKKLWPWSKTDQTKPEPALAMPVAQPATPAEATAQPAMATPQRTMPMLQPGGPIPDQQGKFTFKVGRDEQKSAEKPKSGAPAATPLPLDDSIAK